MFTLRRNQIPFEEQPCNSHVAWNPSNKETPLLSCSPNSILLVECMFHKQVHLHSFQSKQINHNNVKQSFLHGISNSSVSYSTTLHFMLFFKRNNQTFSPIYPLKPHPIKSHPEQIKSDGNHSNLPRTCLK